jgi:NTE family protein
MKEENGYKRMWERQKSLVRPHRKGRMRTAFLLLLLLIPLLSFSAPPRKKVAVVLSGGGAKGMAHIGVLKVIERAGIPVDIITGTSMGSIVGGLYAIGYNAERLDSMVRVQDWPLLLTDKTDTRSQSLSERLKENTYFIAKRFTPSRNVLSQTSGLVEGKNLLRLFDKLASGYRDSMDFNKLPIPFACVATNIVDNTEYDFHSGVLAKAMRTSMSIPGVFSPMRKEAMVLVDGGLRNNFPVDIAREMGADVVIGVTVQGPAKTADDLTSGTSVLGQIVDVNCKNKYDENLARTDVPIRVNTKPYGAASFTPAAIDTLIRRGEEEAMRHWDDLVALKKVIGIDSTFVPRQPQLVLSNDTLPDVTETPKRTEATARVGARFDTEEMAAIQLNASLAIRDKAPLSTDVTLRLGRRIMAEGKFMFHPSEWAQMSLAYTFQHNDINIYEKGDRVSNSTYNEHKLHFTLADFNIRNFNVTLGTRFDYYRFHALLLSDRLPDVTESVKDVHLLSYHADVNYDSENDGYFATRGAKFHAGFAYYTDDFVKYNHHVGFSAVNAMWRMSFAVQQHITLQPMVYGRLLFGSDIPFIKRNTLGGDFFGHYLEEQLPFAGIGYMEFADSHIVALQLQGQYHITTNNYLLVKISGAQHADQVSDLLDHGPMMGYQVGYFYRTFLGPLGATLGYSSKTEKPYFYINLGFVF